MSGQPIRMGPWPGGLNQRDQADAPYTIPPSQLRFILNLDVGDSGVLISRLGCRKCGSATMYSDLSTNGVFSLLGSVDLTTGGKYLVVATHDGGSPGSTKVYYTLSPHSSASFAVAAGGSLTSTFSCMFQYNSLIYFVGDPTGTATGQSRTAMTSGTWTAVANLPRGDLAFVVRERAFVVDKAANKIYWSKATDPTTWAAPDGGFVLINPGDGQLITDVVLLNTQLYIFKRNKTYVFSFTTDPAVDGQVIPVSDTDGAYSACAWGGGIYLVNDRSIYRFQNNTFVDLAPQEAWRLNMALNQLSNLVVSLENDRLVVGPVLVTGNPSPIFTHVSMNLRTNAWSLRVYQNSAGTVPSGAAPSTKSITWRDTDTSLSSGGAGVVYGHRTKVLSFIRTNYPFSDDRLDVDENGVTVSPQYALVTAPIDGGEYDTWKRLHYANARVNNTLSGGDSAVSLQARVGPNLFSTAQTQSIPTGQYGGKVPFRSFRFRSLALGMLKPLVNLGALDPATSGSLLIWEFLLHASSHGREVNTS